MEQYYTPVLMNKDIAVVYDNYLDNNKDYQMAKLLEHSWWYNHWVGSICNKIYNKPTRVWWCGDYADHDSIIYKYAHGWDNENEQYIYANRKIIKESICLLDDKVLINHTKKQYVDCNKYSLASEGEYGIIHPLPLLTRFTAEDNAGGDYHTSYINFDKVGLWAGDVIEIKKRRWNQNINDVVKKDYTELVLAFKENA